MRVLFLNPAGCVGGAERCLLTLLAGLRGRTGVDAALIATAEGPLVDEARSIGVETSVVPLPPALARLGEYGQRSGAVAASAVLRLPLAGRYLVDLRRALARWRPDILHTNGLKAHLLGAAARSGETRVVWHLHDYVSRRQVSRHLLRASAPRCAAAIAVSDDVARDANAACPRLAVHIVENGVDVRRFDPAGPAADLDALGGDGVAPAGTVRVGLVATYARWKGHDVFLSALARLGHLPIRAYVVGGPVYETGEGQWTEADLRARASALGVAERVRFLPFQPDVAPLMRALDVVVHASTAPEPFGLVIAEAMCAARAVVTSAGGGAAALVRPGIDALTHHPGDADGLARAIVDLAASSTRRASLGASARASALTRFTQARLVDEVCAVYGATLTCRAAAHVA
jgi:glycosyltransferase involved in cell wall biosynthesis